LGERPLVSTQPIYDSAEAAMAAMEQLVADTRAWVAKEYGVDTDLIQAVLERATK